MDKIEYVIHLYRLNQKDKALELINEHEITIFDILSHMTRPHGTVDYSKKCLNCKYTTRRAGLYVFCSVKQMKMHIAKTCERFEPR